MDHEGSRSFHNSLKLPLGRSHQCLRPWPRNTSFRLQRGLKRFHQCLQREGLRDRDHIRHSNGTTAVPIIGANSPLSLKFHGMLTSHTGSPPTTAVYPFRQQHTSHMMWVSLQQFQVMSLPELFAKFYHGQPSEWRSYYDTPATVPTPAVPVQQPPPPRTLSIVPLERVNVNRLIAVHQPPPQRNPPVYNAPGPQPPAGQNQTSTARHDFVRKIVAAFEVRSW